VQTKKAREVSAIPGKHSETEEAILIYLYENPEGAHSTDSLASVLEDNSRTSEEVITELETAIAGRTSDTKSPYAGRTRKPEHVQKDIESLIVKALVRGRRQGNPGNITHADIELTPKGEREAIEARNRVRAVAVRAVGDPEDSPTRLASEKVIHRISRGSITPLGKIRHPRRRGSVMTSLKTYLCRNPWRSIIS
jgi:hypothetical protein